MTTLRSTKKQSKPVVTSTAAPAATPATAPAASSTATAVPLVAPPPDTSIPSVPSGFVPVNSADYRGYSPKAAQLAVMPEAVKELQSFSDYAAVFGKTAPPYMAVVQTFDIAEQWAALRTKLEAFDVYCATQELLAWKDVHAFMDRMQPAFELAVQSDGTIATQYPSLVRLFSAQKTIAKRAAVAKKANDKLRAEGKLPTKGNVGKRAKRIAANAALAAVTASAEPPPTSSAATTTAPAPAATPPASTNGATHP